MDNIHEVNWEQHEDGFKLVSPLNFEIKQNGKCRIYTMDGQYDQTFDSPDEATEAIGALLQRGTQS